MSEEKKNSGNASSNSSGKLTPTQKKLGALALIVATIFLGMKLFGSKDDSKAYRDKPIEHVLTDRSSKELGMESLIAQIKMANDKLISQAAENNRLKRDFKKLEDRVTKYDKNKVSDQRMVGRISQLEEALNNQRDSTEAQVKALKEENARLNKLIHKAPTVNTDAESVKVSEKLSNKKLEIKAEKYKRERDLEKQKREEAKKPFLDRSVNIQDAEELYSQNYKKSVESDVLSLDKDGNVMAEAETKINAISIIGEYEDPAQRIAEELANAEYKPEVYLPVGSMVKGVLLSGLYAPTGVNAKKDPFPVVLRVQDEAILPNLKRADVKECFLTLSGYGDLSSERALLRGETLSCVANDNSIIETKFPSYAIGEDGKAGIGGRLITRNGKALRNAMMSGFMQGMSEAFETSKVQKLDISGAASDTYTNAFSSESFNNGVFSGASKALEKLADYYMSMAEQTFPVIEIDAGREVTVTLTQGTTLSTIKQSPEKQIEEMRMTTASQNGNMPMPSAGLTTEERAQLPGALN